MNAISGGKSFQAFFLKYLIAERKKKTRTVHGIGGIKKEKERKKEFLFFF